jgi:hypothetical protein
MSVMRWINLAYAKLWTMDDWTFRVATGFPTVTAGSSAVGSIPTDFGASLGFWRADGTQLNYLKPRQFNNRWLGNTGTGLPEDFTVINGALTVGPASSQTATYSLLYERTAVDLVEDDDVPLLPGPYHYLLVHGATITGLVEEQDFTYQFHAGEWSAGIQAMQFEYLDDQRGQPAQFGSWDDAFGSAW